MCQTRIIQILRQRQSLPLKLPQNSLLRINSTVAVNVRLLPEWRDDGHITLEQTFTKDCARKIDWSVSVSEGKKEGLTSVDVSIQQIQNDQPQEESFDKIQSEKEVTQEEIISAEKVEELATLIARIPEMCNVNCSLEGGDIVVEKKLEGEKGFEFITKGGNIVIDKLRGDTVFLDSKFDKGQDHERIGGTIHIRKACEAQKLNVVVNKGGRFRAKMLNVSNANIEAEDMGMNFDTLDDDDDMALIDISSIYTSGDGAHLIVNKKSTDLSTRSNDSVKKVRLKSSHGHVSVGVASSCAPGRSTMYDQYNQVMAHVELGGVNGSFDVSVQKFWDENIALEGPDFDDTLPMAAKIHVDSLSPGQANIITSDFGSIGISLDRKIEADIRLLSTPFMNNFDANILLDEDEHELIEAISNHDDGVEKLMSTVKVADNNSLKKAYKISLETDAFSGHRCSDMKYSEYVHGAIDNKSQEPNSRFDVRTKGLSSSVGKIRIEDAAGQALQGFSGSKAYHDENDGVSKMKAIDLPLFVAATKGNIKLESLSWFGAIARRYGVDNENRDLGRQAKAGTRK